MQNLEHIKPGDEIAIPSRDWSGLPHVVTVDRVTATQIKAGTWTVRRRDALVIDGHTGIRRCAFVPTAEDRERWDRRIRITRARLALRELVVDDKNLEAVELLLAGLK
ncbi:MAG TPA: hypothetical protein VNT52_00850 [Acidimicrobiales bacterium]|nr:hypothetical protein [Acidimicrobiales bacterium]